MATAFTKIYDHARALVGDTGRIKGISNDQLDSAIRLALLNDGATFDETTNVDASGDRMIEPDVSAKSDLLRISLRTALALIAPQSDVVSYATPVLKVTRGNGPEGLYAKLDQALHDLLEGNTPVVAGETDLDQYLTGMTEFNNKMAGG